MRKNKGFKSFLLVLSLLMAGCTGKTLLKPKEYLEWIEQPGNGTAETKDIGDFEFSLLYKPVDYIIALEMKDQNPQQEEIVKRREELQGFQYYTFRIRSNKDQEFWRTGLGSEEEYYQRLEYYVGYAQDDIKLVEGNDTLSCTLYHFERNYGVSPYSHLVLSFKETAVPNHHDKIFIYNDQVLGVGKVAIKLDADQLENLPKLNL